MSLHLSKCHIVGNRMSLRLISATFVSKFDQHKALSTAVTNVPASGAVRSFNKFSVERDFQQCGILTCVDSDQPVQPPVKLRYSKCCLVSSLIVMKYFSDKQRLLSDCAYAQADLRLCWSHIPHYCKKSHVAAQIRWYNVYVVTQKCFSQIMRTYTFL